MTIQLLIEKHGFTIDLSDNEAVLLQGSNSEFLSKTDSIITLKRTFLSEEKKVQDCWRYILKRNESNREYSLHYPDNQTAIDFDPEKDTPTSSISDIRNKKNIVLVLESPHKDEYNSSFEPKKPASGTTGLNIHNYLLSHVIPLLKSFGLNLTEPSYNIIISNPIPYQTSLVKIYNKKICTSLRDKVWAGLYEFHKNDFETRISEYNPSILINACTAGVKDKLQINIDRSKKYETSHPSIWQRSLAPFKKT